jgi:hypothetical protein
MRHRRPRRPTQLLLNVVMKEGRQSDHTIW